MYLCVGGKWHREDQAPASIARHLGAALRLSN
jgi:hypothetical protein